MNHIATFEGVEHPTKGISLLDEFRSYLITGTHAGVNRFYMTMNGVSEQHSSEPTELTTTYIQDSFAKFHREEPGRSERACIASGGGMRRSEEAKVSEEAVRRKGGGGGPRKLGMG